tara:strand:+ start:766 stop:924 length:159 start_codon:yes stop_codon:yes gene_type:complete
MKIKKAIKEWFNFEPNKQLIKNLKRHAEKEKAEQQKSKVQDSSTNKSRDQRG